MSEEGKRKKRCKLILKLFEFFDFVFISTK